MKKDERRGNRTKQRAILDDNRQKYIALSENDPTLDEDSDEGIYGNLRIKLGKTNVELHKIIAAL